MHAGGVSSPESSCRSLFLLIGFRSYVLAQYNNLVESPILLHVRRRNGVREAEGLLWSVSKAVPNKGMGLGTRVCSNGI